MRMLLTSIARGGVVPDSARCNGVGHWLFHPCFRGGSTKNHLHLNRFCWGPPVLYDQSLIEVLHFYNSEAKRLLLMVLVVRPIGPWFLKSCMNKALRIMCMCALWTKPDVHYWLSIPRNKHWTLGLSDISQY